MEFFNNKFLSLLLGTQDSHLKILEDRLSVEFSVRGNHIEITGIEPDIDFAHDTLNYLYQIIERDEDIAPSDVETSLNVIQTNYWQKVQKNLDDSSKKTQNPNNKTSDDLTVDTISIPTRKKIVHPRTSKQAEYIEEMLSKDLVFGIGPAGTGKTYLAVAVAVSRLISGKIEKIILSRPAVEAGERLGFLPGDMKEKVDPYLRPLYDALYDLLPSDQVVKHIASGQIEIAPLAFMRGRTLSDAAIILDEAQNTTTMQMKMFLTRLGSNSSMVVTGDLSQIDLPSGISSGLKDACNVLENMPEIAFTYFDYKDVVRHPLVSKIVHAYDKQNNR